MLVGWVGQLAGVDDDLFDEVLGGLIFALIIGLIVKLFAIEAVENRKTSNQGTRRSIKAALTALSFGLVLGLTGDSVELMLGLMVGW